MFKKKKKCYISHISTSPFLLQHIFAKAILNAMKDEDNKRVIFTNNELIVRLINCSQSDVSPPFPIKVRVFKSNAIENTKDFTNKKKWFIVKDTDVKKIGLEALSYLTGDVNEIMFVFLFLSFFL